MLRRAVRTLAMAAAATAFAPAAPRAGRCAAPRAEPAAAPLSPDRESLRKLRARSPGLSQCMHSLCI